MGEIVQRQVPAYRGQGITHIITVTEPEVSEALKRLGDAVTTLVGDGYFESGVVRVEPYMDHDQFPAAPMIEAEITFTVY